MLAAMYDKNGSLVHIGVTVKVIDVIEMAFTSSEMNAETTYCHVNDILICVDIRPGFGNNSIVSACRDELIFLHAKHGLLWLGKEDIAMTEVVECSSL